MSKCPTYSDWDQNIKLLSYVHSKVHDLKGRDFALAAVAASHDSAIVVTIAGTDQILSYFVLCKYELLLTAVSRNSWWHGW